MFAGVNSIGKSGKVKQKNRVTKKEAEKLREQKVSEFLRQEKLLFGDKGLADDLSNLQKRAWVRFKPKDERKRANDLFVANFNHREHDFDFGREKNKSNRAFRAMFGDKSDDDQNDNKSDHFDQSNPEEVKDHSELDIELD